MNRVPCTEAPTPILTHGAPIEQLPKELMAHILGLLNDRDFVSCLLTARMWHVYAAHEWIQRAHARTTPSQAARTATPAVMQCMTDRMGVAFGPDQLCDAIHAGRMDNIEWLLHSVAVPAIARDHRLPPWQRSCWCGATVAAASHGDMAALSALRGAGLYRPSMRALRKSIKAKCDRVTSVLLDTLSANGFDPAEAAPSTDPFAHVCVALKSVMHDTHYGINAATVLQHPPEPLSERILYQIACGAVKHENLEWVTRLVPHLPSHRIPQLFDHAIQKLALGAMRLLVQSHRHTVVPQGRDCPEGAKGGTVDTAKTRTHAGTLHWKSVDDMVQTWVCACSTKRASDTLLCDGLAFLCSTFGAMVPFLSAGLCAHAGPETARYMAESWRTLNIARDPHARYYLEEHADDLQQGQESVAAMSAHALYDKVTRHIMSHALQHGNLALVCALEQSLNLTLALSAIDLFRMVFAKYAHMVSAFALRIKGKHPMDVALSIAVIVRDEPCVQALAAHATTRGLLVAADMALWCWSLSLRRQLLARARALMGHHTKASSETETCLLDPTVNLIAIMVGGGRGSFVKASTMLSPLVRKSPRWGNDRNHRKDKTIRPVADADNDGEMEQVWSQEWWRMHRLGLPTVVFGTTLREALAETMHSAPLDAIVGILNQCGALGDTNYAGQMLRCAVYSDRHDLARFILERVPACKPIITFAAVEHAARKGSVAMLQVLHDAALDSAWITSTMTAAVCGGHMDAVRWLQANRTERCHHKAFEHAAQLGDTRIFEFLHEHYGCRCNYDTLTNAIACDRIDMIRFMLGHWPPPTHVFYGKHIIECAIIHDRAAILALLLERQPMWRIGANTINVALKVGSWRCLAVVQSMRPDDMKCTLLSECYPPCACPWTIEVMKALLASLSSAT